MSPSDALFLVVHFVLKAPPPPQIARLTETKIHEPEEEIVHRNLQPLDTIGYGHLLMQY